MPELPEVEAVCRKLRKEAVGGIIAEASVLRARTIYPQDAEQLSKVERHTIESVERRGKNIILHLSGGYALRIHLRMTGNLLVIPDARLQSAKVRVSFRFRDGRGLVFEDTRALGRVNLYEEKELDELLGDIGIEPLSKAFTVAKLVEMASQSRKPSKLFLMDQQHIAGIGNMYAAEALFRARINPKQPMNGIGKKKIEALHSAILAILKEAVKVAVQSYKQPGSYKEMDFAVYGRKGEPCAVCKRKIARIVQGDRSTYYCPHCQR